MRNVLLQTLIRIKAIQTPGTRWLPPLAMSLPQKTFGLIACPTEKKSQYCGSYERIGSYDQSLVAHATGRTSINIARFIPLCYDTTTKIRRLWQFCQSVLMALCPVPSLVYCHSLYPYYWILWACQKISPY